MSTSPSCWETSQAGGLLCASEMFQASLRGNGNLPRSPSGPFHPWSDLQVEYVVRSGQTTLSYHRVLRVALQVSFCWEMHIISKAFASESAVPSDAQLDNRTADELPSSSPASNESSVIIPPNVSLTPFRVGLVDILKGSPIGSRTRLQLSLKQLNGTPECSANTSLDQEVLIPILNFNCTPEFSQVRIVSPMPGQLHANVNPAVLPVQYETNNDISYSNDHVQNGTNNDLLISNDHVSSPQSDSDLSSRIPAGTVLKKTKRPILIIILKACFLEYDVLSSCNSLDQGLPFPNITCSQQETAPQSPIRLPFCSTCKIKFLSENTLNLHLHSVNGLPLDPSIFVEVGYVCSHCLTEFSRVEDKRLHECNAIPAGQINGELCAYIASSRKAFRIHMWDAYRTEPIRMRREVPMSQAGPDDIPIIPPDTDESNDLSSGYETHSAESPNLQITISQSDSEPNERRVTENDSAINPDQDNPSGNTENRFVLVHYDDNFTVRTNANSDCQTVSTCPTSNVRSGELFIFYSRKSTHWFALRRPRRRPRNEPPTPLPPEEEDSNIVNPDNAFAPSSAQEQEVRVDVEPVEETSSAIFIRRFRAMEQSDITANNFAAFEELVDEYCADTHAAVLRNFAAPRVVISDEKSDTIYHASPADDGAVI
ncbi:hypothetical protein AVEN_61825-1 [Araneus ventricosus]|uniref:Uncharacterized protein n=1 Tax=Araneus ventricosus TaxID=182803 RepID=A0A4Y2LSE9_ARAVE|nr:hypothetical protein AVEN_61825-1 [Araneus ventricosus]